MIRPQQVPIERRKNYGSNYGPKNSAIERLENLGESHGDHEDQQQKALVFDATHVAGLAFSLLPFAPQNRDSSRNLQIRSGLGNGCHPSGLPLARGVR